MATANTRFAPDLILTNGHILTLDDTGTVASALAIRDGRIIAVGTDDDIRPLADARAGTTVHDLGGAIVTPGLIDAHNHLLSTGMLLSQVPLFGCRSLGEVFARIAERVQNVPPGTWVIGRGWDESLLKEGRHPTRRDLDPIAPDHPVVIHRVWNKLVANSAAMRQAGITRETPDPPATGYAGSFERDAAGEPTGLFHARAKALIADAIPTPSEADRVAAIRTACAAYNAVGITGVAEPGLTPDECRAFHRAALDGHLTVRTDLMLGGWGFYDADEEAVLSQRFESVGFMAGFGDDLLRLGGVKFMPDGGISDRTAKFHPDQPYEGEPENTGTWVVEPDRLVELIGWVHRLGFAMDIHTCGSLAQDVVIEAFSAAIASDPDPHARIPHRVHHAYAPTDRALSLMSRHHIPAVVSSPFLAELGEGFVAAIGEERAASVMPMRRYLQAGVPLAGSSDTPIASYNPWQGMAASIHRTTLTGRVLGADEALTSEEALRSYTTGGAAAIGVHGRRGTLEVGKLADLVVLPADQHPLRVSPTDLAGVRPIATLVGGQWVWGGLD